MTTATKTFAAGWDGPGVGRKKKRTAFRWRNVVWALIYPRREQHMVPTVSGVLLIGLSLGIGMAAYNSSNNILFITLALMLACLILSGVLAWFNFSKVRWQISRPTLARVDQSTSVTLELVNGKTFLPTYGMDCVMRARPAMQDKNMLAESTLTGKGVDVKAIWKEKQEEEVAHLRLSSRLDPQDAVILDWEWVPTKRGRWKLGLRHVASFFPFGFFNKRLSAVLEHEVIVWPAAREYQWDQSTGAKWLSGASNISRTGQGSDLLALRRYETGDSHRLIHWKASARTRQLLVRQFSAEATESFSLWVQSKDVGWAKAEQFEVLVSFAATLAEDLFRAGRLSTVRIDDAVAKPIRHWRDLESWLDTLAVLEREKSNADTILRDPLRSNPNLITFEPEGQAGVIAMIDGEKAATA
jgi:uncharacterized protein (DUF58 family)